MLMLMMVLLRCCCMVVVNGGVIVIAIVLCGDCVAIFFEIAAAGFAHLSGMARWCSAQASFMKKEVTSVGSTTPVADFVAMTSRRDVDLLVPACKGLMQRVEDLVELYVGGGTDPFADMVAAMRAACVRDEPMLFNDFGAGQ